MGKVYNNKKCLDCGQITQCIEIFDKFYCRDCYSKKPHRKGHSGMVKKEINIEDFADKTLVKEITLKKVKKSNPLFVKWYLEHYPKSKGIMGRTINYLIYYYSNPIGIIGANSPPLYYKKFISFFNFSNYIKGQSEKYFVNNNVYRIVVKPNDNNIGTKILKLFRKTIQQDYFIKYGESLLGIITFVELPKSGSIYRADNWNYLGITEGTSIRRTGSLDDWTNKQYSKGTKKHIFAKKL